MENIILSLVCILLTVGIWWLVKLIWLRPLNINHFYERVMILFALSNPELLT